ncbi:DMT family transporter [Bosea sp. 2YAB26]|uniref:DMT family transporter n=1 Tax=Bosea sp. 2YAB26 TaxID=3237478 RepID=UPI003F9303F4
MASSAENRRGIIAMLLAMFLFTCNDALMKLAREVYPVGQAISLRAVFAVTTALAMIWMMGEGRKLGEMFRPLVLLRGMIEAAIALIFIWSVAKLPLGNITAILMASPLIILVLAVALGIEKVGWRRTVAVAVGFIGVLVVIRPTPEHMNIAAIAALVSAILAAVRDLVTRRIGNHVPSTVISFTATIIVGLSAFALGFFETWVPVQRIETVYVGGAAVLVSLGSFCIVNAFRNTDVGVVTGYRYSGVAFAVLIGHLLWGEIPDAWAVTGIALIAGSGLYTLHRQRVVPSAKLKIEGGPAS